MNNIGVFVFECLPTTQTFVHGYLRHLTAYRPHVLTKLYNPRSPYDFSSLEMHFQRQYTPLSQMVLFYLRARFFTHRALSFALSRSDTFAAYIHEHHLQLVHAHFALDGLYALKFTEQCGIPLVVSLHGGYDVNVVPRMRRFPREYFFQKVAHFTVPSTPLRQQLIALGCPGSKVSVLPNGITCTENTARSPRENSSEIRILLVGRMTAMKGILDALKAIARLAPGYTNVRLTVAGGSAPGVAESVKEFLSRIGFSFPFNSQIGYHTAVARFIETAGLSSRVTIVYDLSNQEVRRLMAESDIFLLPSRTAADGDTEGMPLALLEAQDAGLPVITTIHSGNPEAVLPGKSAFLVPEGDVDAMTDKLEFLIQNATARREMGAAGKIYVAAQRNMENYCSTLQTIYRLVLDRRHSSSSYGEQP